MKVKLNVELKNFDSTSLKDEQGEVKTIADIFMGALQTPLKEDEKDSGESRIRRYELGKTVFRNKKGSIEIVSEDIVMLKERVRKIYLSPIVYGNVCEVLNEKE